MLPVRLQESKTRGKKERLIHNLFADLHMLKTQNCVKTLKLQNRFFFFWKE